MVIIIIIIIIMMIIIMVVMNIIIIIFIMIVNIEAIIFSLPEHSFSSYVLLLLRLYSY